MKGFDTSLRLHSSLSYGFLPLRQNVTLNSRIRYSRSYSLVMLKLLTSTAYGSHHVSPVTRVRSTPVKSPLVKSLTQLTGWNQSSHQLDRRAFSSDSKAAESDSEGSDTKSSTAIVSTKPNLNDSLTVSIILNKVHFFFFCFRAIGNFMIMGFFSIHNVGFKESIEMH